MVLMQTAKTLHIQYYARLREERGLSTETLELPADTPTVLYQHLKEHYGFSLDNQILRVAVNHAFVPWDYPLQSGDTVVFIPPVAGG